MLTGDRPALSASPASDPAQAPSPTSSPPPPSSSPSSSPSASNGQPEVSVEVMTTTPSRIEQPLADTVGAASVTVLTEPEIESQEPLTAPEVLWNVPGLAVQESGTAGESAVIGIRGADPLQTLVLLDGVRINMPFRGSADLGSQFLDGVDQIETVRGAYSALYGSDAMGGVVNLRMLPPT
ncbi:MAG TPA: TonB-dependent receptor plug domain-containing protein, partial [Nitrospiria bacterium]|nr:TonB-dependent receptor plug domain-containing protein [Nitrospiria bacterium]